MRTPLTALLLLSSACTVDGIGGPSTDGDLQGVQIGEEGDELPCDWVRTATDPADAPVVLDASDEVSGTLLLTGGRTLPIRVAWQPTGDVFHAVLEPRVGADPDLCLDERFEVDARLTIDASPTLYIEGAAVLWSRQEHQAAWRLEVGRGAIDGGIRPTLFDAAGWDEVSMVTLGYLEPDRPWHGQVQWRARGPVGATGEIIGDWTAE